MPLSIDRVEAGLAYWRSAGWNPDLHNDFYANHAAWLLPVDGQFDDQWWERIWPVLQAWSANRRGGTRAAMTARARSQYRGLRSAWSHGVAPRLSSDIATVDWADVADFTAHAKAIKGVASPVFTSKLCHFLAPRIFPVVDNQAMGNPFRTYEGYFCAARALWLGTDDSTRSALCDGIARQVGPDLSPAFPMACKLVELHCIGLRHPG